MNATPTVRFGDLPVGAYFRFESCFGQKFEPRECEYARRFFNGEVPGYPGKSPFYGWNASVGYAGGDYNWMSLADDTLVTPDAGPTLRSSQH